MERTRRSPARWLGPLALIAVVVAFAAVVSGSNDKAGGSSTSRTGTTHSSTTQTRSATTAKTSTAVATTPKVYVVKVGDTLGAIAGKTGVSLERLQELNPDVDSNLMTAGQKIRLK